MATAPKVVQIVADSVAVGDETVTTVVALLEDGNIVYTGAAPHAEWHYLPPIPSPSETD